MEDNATSATRLLDAISTTTASSNLPTLLADNISSLGLWDDNDTDGSIGMNNRSNGSFRGVAGNNTFLMAQIPFYILIFLLSVVGNILVIVTVIQNKKMRSLTNVFLLNLSVSDLLLSVFCMPFTLIPIYLKDFIFGEAMCIMVRYLQGEYHVTP
ncbi:hypothetical protein RRG08_052059 [Elysia crispata]|uniref:G-protein coupled receptors family 1 profile domain-containing protein n=1 Tax=Elysia crispata TaxID=231223 RepID=A0AAE1DSA2_9GAST|nr:hypothetical protein RRG08_052059 [Elysia crispata]